MALMKERRPLCCRVESYSKHRGWDCLLFKGVIFSFIPRRGLSPPSSPAPLPTTSLLLIPAVSNLWLQQNEVSQVNCPWPWRKPMNVTLSLNYSRRRGGRLQAVWRPPPTPPAREMAVLSCNNGAPRHQAANGFWFRFNFQGPAMPRPHPSAGDDSAALTACLNGCLPAYHTSA